MTNLDPDPYESLISYLVCPFVFTIHEKFGQLFRKPNNRIQVKNRKLEKKKIEAQLYGILSKVTNNITPSVLCHLLF